MHQCFVLAELSRIQALNQGQNLGLSAGFQSWLSTVEDRRLRQTTVFDCFGACLASVGAARVHRECSKARNCKAGRKWIFSTPGQTNPDVNVATWHKGVRRLVYTTDLAFTTSMVYLGQTVVPGAMTCVVPGADNPGTGCIKTLKVEQRVCRACASNAQVTHMLASHALSLSRSLSPSHAGTAISTTASFFAPVTPEYHCNS